MKAIFKNPLVKTSKPVYLNLLIIIAPLLNLLSGLNLDMYAPSMPAIARHFSVSSMLVKNTMSSTMLGMMVGSLLFGLLMDSMGRKRALLLGIFIYVIASLVAPWSQTIFQLLILRFIQGVMVASISIGCRALVADNFSGHRYAVAILYCSLAYGLAPIIGPFIGGIVQHYLGWQANFYMFSLMGILFLLALLVLVEESISQYQSLNLYSVMTQYIKILKNKFFIVGGVIGIIVQIELLLYPTLGPFIVEETLHRTVLVYGNTALIVGAGYLLGTLINRGLLKYLTPKRISEIGSLMALVAVLLAILFAVFCPLNFLSLLLPLLIICISAGFIYPHITATCLKQFPSNTGMAGSILITLVALGSAFGIYVLSYFTINTLARLSVVYSLLILPQVTIFFFIYRKLFNSSHV